jgi:hypothetical protein
MAKKNTPEEKPNNTLMAKKNTPEEKPDAAEKVEAKLKQIDTVGSIIYKYLKKWLLAIVGLVTAASIYFGYDFFGAIGLKNPNTATKSKMERSFSHKEHDESFYDSLESSGHIEDVESDYYYEDDYYDLDSTMVYAEEDAFVEQTQQMVSSDELFFEEDTIVASKYIVDYLYDVDMEGDTFYIDVYSDGTDSIYYPKFEY